MKFKGLFGVISLVCLASSVWGGSQCVVDSDCNPLGEVCSMNICSRKPLFPLRINEYFALVLLAIGVALSNASGLGGGAIATAILLGIMGMHQTEAVPITNFLMFVGCVARLIVSCSEKHPNFSHKPAIHYDFTIILLPMSLTGSMLGVLINTVFPELILNILVFLLFTYVLIKSFQKALKTCKIESLKKDHGLN